MKLAIVKLANKKLIALVVLTVLPLGVVAAGPPVADFIVQHPESATPEGITWLKPYFYGNQAGEKAEWARKASVAIKSHGCDSGVVIVCADKAGTDDDPRRRITVQTSNNKIIYVYEDETSKESLYGPKGKSRPNARMRKKMAIEKAERKQKGASSRTPASLSDSGQDSPQTSHKTRKSGSPARSPGTQQDESSSAQGPDLSQGGRQVQQGARLTGQELLSVHPGQSESPGHPSRQPRVIWSDPTHHQKQPKVKAFWEERARHALKHFDWESGEITGAVHRSKPPGGDGRWHISILPHPSVSGLFIHAFEHDEPNQEKRVIPLKPDGLPTEGKEHRKWLDRKYKDRRKKEKKMEMKEARKAAEKARQGEGSPSVVGPLLDPDHGLARAKTAQGTQQVSTSQSTSPERRPALSRRTDTVSGRPKVTWFDPVDHHTKPDIRAMGHARFDWGSGEEVRQVGGMTDATGCWR